MASALVPLANLTLSSAAATLTFSSISGSFRDLMLVANYTTSTGSYVQVRINGDTGSNYSFVEMFGYGSGSGSSGSTNAQFWLDPAFGHSTSEPAIGQIHFLDYSATDKHKPALVKWGQAGVAVETSAVRWANTSAITSFVLYPSSGNFATGSTFALYGVSA